MSDSKNDYSQAEAVTGKKSKRDACKRHCAKWWWAHLIIFIIGAVVIVIVAIYGVTPRIAQDKINAADLQVQHVKISNPTSDGFDMTINSTITTDGQVKADIDPFQGSFYLKGKDKPFLIFPFPATNADKFQNVNAHEHITIQDMEAFTEFNAAFIGSETLEVEIKGYTYVTPKGLSKKYGVNFYKSLKFPGLNSFKGTVVSDAKANYTADPTKVDNFFATATLQNPSYYTIELGNATFNNYSPAGALLGKLFIDNFNLAPGENKVQTRGRLNQGDVVSYLVSTGDQCGKPNPLVLQGVSVNNHGQDLPYFGNALHQVNQTVEVNIGEVLSASLGSNICPKSS
ncbi:hypothetical protein VHEMI03986 [[Torrubiella] hemipterigena]|uniref:Uncharacterized protein n=1 Tax=[Torrubiella] hemipterigena TaxID=1531966 RepID=A0A0A1TCV1_9HYPO|nr:hypothetical protein VHEMI03986 [[Torrubiella] hemipterigena]